MFIIDKGGLFPWIEVFIYEEILYKSSKAKYKTKTKSN